MSAKEQAKRPFELKLDDETKIATMTMALPGGVNLIDARFIDALNVEEDRHNQRSGVRAVERLLPTLEPTGDAEWLAAKVPQQ